uniref:Protein MON2 homolog n=1 Tax=Lepeophtheirus salmonis TaxID=72036 RepID=A0A0K2TVD6_LEPSM
MKRNITPVRMKEEERDRLLEALSTDLKNISLESRKKFPSVKESAEEAIVKIRSYPEWELKNLSHQVLIPLAQGCETKEPKIVRSSLHSIQRLILAQVLDYKGALSVTQTLWMLMEASVEEIKILQTLTLLVTSSRVLVHESLSKALVLALRLHYTKDPDINTLAGATVRQLIPSVFERVSKDDEEETVFSNDAHQLFQDIVLLVSGERPLWLQGIHEIKKTFGLELLESLLSKFSNIFSNKPEFTFLLKEKVCSLVIKLFSPSLKYKFHLSNDKPNFSMTSKLLRLVSVLVLDYHKVLTTETEIFLSLTAKFLDPDKPSWQNCSALEVIHKILVKTDLITFICLNFDLKEHSTNVFQDIVNGLGAYVQNVMMSSSSSPLDVEYNGSNSGNMVGPSSGGNGASNNGNNSVLYGGLSPQPGFYYRSVWKPLTMSFIGGHTKEIYLETSEKIDPPLVSEGYGISLAYVCLLDTVRSLSLLIQGSGECTGVDRKLLNDEVSKRLIDSSWCGILASLSLLLDASTDDASTENILKHLQTYASIAGLLGLNKARDAFLAAICKASLPPHYTLTVLKSTASTQTVSGPRIHHNNESHSQQASENDLRHQVVAVGTPLPTASLPASAHQGPVMLTSKNLQCMRAILSVAHCHGNLLGTSWHIILTSLQHLVWILGLKPVANGGALSSTSPTNSSTSTNVENSSSVITTAVMADLPVLSNMVTRLFESSCDLSDESVNHLIEALCVLSEESMELATLNREPSLFAVAKLLETALVNLTRLDVIWRPITNHLLLVCQHPHLRMRQWGSEALTFLCKQSLQQDYDPPINDSSKLQTLLLSPLFELCAIPFPDVRQKQLDTVLHIIHTSGEALKDGWPVILNIIGSLDESHSDILIRNSFQCIQLIFTDYLPALPYRCYPLCVETAAKFGSQTAELNVSLTAIGLLWNLSDYFFQNVNSIELDNSSSSVCSIFPEFPGCKNMPSFDKLWMCLYCKLKDLCLDNRPSVRKSAGQTLFSTIAAHGSILQSNTWQAVLWQVLFPLLECVIIQSECASTEKESDAIMIHHSRNTAQKQWAETKVLTVSGVVRVFNTKRALLKSLGDYSQAWTVLLEFVEKVALSETMEVSLAALKALHEMVSIYENKVPSPEIDWPLCWKVWINIGNVKAKYAEEIGDSSVHSTVLLTGLMQIFQSLFPHLRPCFSHKDVQKLGEVLLLCLRVPVDGESDLLTSVHKSCLDVIKIVKSHCVEEKSRSNIPALFEILFQFTEYAFLAPEKSKKNGTSKSTTRFHEKLSMFGGIIMEIIAEFYQETCTEPFMLEDNILYKIVVVLGKPLRKKYDCFRDNDWRVAITVLLKILRRGIQIARCETDKGFDSFWMELGEVLECFLFPKEANTDEDRSADEAVDCEFVELLKTQVLPYPVSVPEFFIRKMVVLLNRGSIHTSVKLNKDNSFGFREDFAQQCFETLLEFSLLETDDTVDLGSMGTASSSSSVSSASVSPCRENSLTNKLAIITLLVRFRDVLSEATENDKLYQNMPLPRAKIAEITFVLKAIATVISSAKKTNKVNKKTWKQILGLYPLLVQCTGCASTQINEAVKLALMEYNDLLKPF